MAQLLFSQYLLSLLACGGWKIPPCGTYLFRPGCEYLWPVGMLVGTIKEGTSNAYSYKQPQLGHSQDACSPFSQSPRTNTQGADLTPPIAQRVPDESQPGARPPTKLTFLGGDAVGLYQRATESARAPELTGGWCHSITKQ